MTVMMVQRDCSLQPGVDYLYRAEEGDVFFVCELTSMVKGRVVEMIM